MDLSLLYGRRELVPIVDDHHISEIVQRLPTMDVGRKVRCRRCDSCYDRAMVRLPNNQYYCPNCINLGRVSTLDQFYHVSEPNRFTPIADPLSWRGKLSPLQAKIAEEVRISMGKHEERLLWAVTGAGKTEMIFPTIAQAIKNQERVCLASPRVDVCLELFPRLQSAFRKVSMALLHGRQDEPYRYCQLTVCTTHQLLRFYRAFDLLIIDEVDSFPYAANPRLLFATKHARKTTGALLMMTATPGRILTNQIRQHKLNVSYLPLRYHGHLLPTINTVRISEHWREKLSRHQLPPCVRKWVRNHLDRKKRFLMFVPHVADLPVIQKALQSFGFETKFLTVHAADSERLDKVQMMRKNELDFLVTTTILERGVTFPKIDVCVLGADEDIFSSSALVQIAGRVGRSADCPNGEVTFFIKQNARNVQSAVSQIRYMNRLGKKLQS